MMARRGMLTRQQGVTAGDVATWLAVAAAHGGALVWMMQPGTPPTAPRLTQAFQVSFFSEPVPVQPQPPPPAPVRTPPPVAPPPLVAPPNPASEAPLPAPSEPVPETREAPVPPPAAPPPALVSVAAPPEAAVIPPDYRAAYLNNPRPRYPEASRHRREEGVVMLKVLVSAEGAPEQVQIDQSSGFEELDRAAIAIVRERWRFAPARQGARAVPAWVIVPLQFKLRNR